MVGVDGAHVQLHVDLLYKPEGVHVAYQTSALVLMLKPDVVIQMYNVRQAHVSILN